ncbi:hypothetical protein ACFOZ7_01500 [Natribaculum luteum]|uniref:Uncharacterized protein n=1 Tax=Natribaculum luteum TaxID=1586232 RepID=A0ABD5NUI3_9EURY|nr:hypothetical protein [Natribaculum luteum]
MPAAATTRPAPTPKSAVVVFLSLREVFPDLGAAAPVGDLFEVAVVGFFASVIATAHGDAPPGRTRDRASVSLWSIISSAPSLAPV